MTHQDENYFAMHITDLHNSPENFDFFSLKNLATNEAETSVYR